MVREGLLAAGGGGPAPRRAPIMTLKQLLEMLDEVYIDASVTLAHLFLENRRPPADFWDNTLAASRLIEYEVWTILHARAFAESHGEAAAALLGRIVLLELSPSSRARSVRFPYRFAPSTRCIWRRPTTCASTDRPSSSQRTISACRTPPGRWVFRSAA